MQQTQRYQAHWRINRTDSPHVGRTGTKVVSASAEDKVEGLVKSEVSKQLRRCPQEDVCVFMVNKFKK